MSGLWADLAFWVFAIAAVWFGLRVFVTDSMIRASYALLASFLNVGAILVLLLAEYVGVALLFMMTVEMVVMALFMVMFMMNPAGLNPMQMVHQHRWSIAAGALTAGGLAVGLTVPTWPDRQLTSAQGTIEALGHELLGGSMLVFESVGVTLLATMVGAVVLSSARGRFSADAAEGSIPPPLDPDDPDSWAHAEPETDDSDHDHAGHMMADQGEHG
ncbi:MAG: NADH-quinone oxidoreductase subunit J [Euzebya sp.]